MCVSFFLHVAMWFRLAVKPKQQIRDVNVMQMWITKMFPTDDLGYRQTSCAIPMMFVCSPDHGAAL